MIISTEARTCKASIVVCIRPIINSFCRSRLSKIILSINRTCCGLVSQWCSHQFSPTKSMVKYWILCKQMLSKHLEVSVFHMMSTRGQYTGLQGHVKMELALTIDFTGLTTIELDSLSKCYTHSLFKATCSITSLETSGFYETITT